MVTDATAKERYESVDMRYLFVYGVRHGGGDSRGTFPYLG